MGEPTGNSRRPGAGGGPASGETGLILFARYASPPNALGYCGPQGQAGLLQATARGEHPEGLRPLIAHFEGARPYLEAIATDNGIADPLDQRVVEAYWVGNDLLRDLPTDALVQTLQSAFSYPVVDTLDGAIAAAAGGGLAHHSFHVFAVYPWLRLLRAGERDPALGVLDRCRVRWGQVEGVTTDAVSVRTQALAFDGSSLTLGPEHTEQARSRIEGASVAPHLDDLQPGATVALHWDWVCDRLSADSVRWLRDCTQRNLDAINSTSPSL